MTSGQEELIAAILDFLAVKDDAGRPQIHAMLAREVEQAGRAGLIALHKRLALSGSGWQYFEPDPLARRLHHVLADSFMHPGSALHGMEHVTAVRGRPVVIIANHLSYADANVIDILLERHGGGELAGRLTTIAGPKVFVDLQRRFSSLCFGSIRTAQSSALSTGEAVMSPREVARAAQHSIAIALERLALGDALLVFGEGTRSRTGAMQPMLPGVARYFEGPPAFILPAGIVGTDAAFPVGDNRLHFAPVEVRFGRPIDTAELRSCTRHSRRLMIDVVGLAVASLLPAARHGTYGDATPALQEAREVLSALGARV